jgi:hypothetical protein
MLGCSLVRNPAHSGITYGPKGKGGAHRLSPDSDPSDRHPPTLAGQEESGIRSICQEPQNGAALAGIGEAVKSVICVIKNGK